MRHRTCHTWSAVRGTQSARCDDTRKKCGGLNFLIFIIFFLISQKNGDGTVHFFHELGRNFQVLQTAKQHVWRALRSTRAMERVLLVVLLRTKKSSHSCGLLGNIWRTWRVLGQMSYCVYYVRDLKRVLGFSPRLERISPRWVNLPSPLAGKGRRRIAERGIVLGD